MSGFGISRSIGVGTLPRCSKAEAIHRLRHPHGEDRALAEVMGHGAEPERRRGSPPTQAEGQRHLPGSAPVARDLEVGAAVGVVWNYAVSATLVWRVR